MKSNVYFIKKYCLSFYEIINNVKMKIVFEFSETSWFTLFQLQNTEIFYNNNRLQQNYTSNICCCLFIWAEVGDLSHNQANYYRNSSFLSSETFTLWHENVQGLYLDYKGVWTLSFPERNKLALPVPFWLRCRFTFLPH